MLRGDTRIVNDDDPGMSRTIWVFGDQLNRRIGALADADPDEDRVLLVESRALLDAVKHRQRGHMVLTAMRRFAEELSAAGFTVDIRRAATLADGLAAHRAQRRPAEVIATEPLSWDARRRTGGPRCRSGALGPVPLPRGGLRPLGPGPG